jgi:hypothetical protein
MKQVYMAFLFGLTSLVANAQIYKIDKPVLCSSLKNVIEYVSSTYREEPFLNGVGDKSKYIMMVNQRTHTWTMIEYSDSTACVIGSGDNFNLITLGKTV